MYRRAQAYQNYANGTSDSLPTEFSDGREGRRRARRGGGDEKSAAHSNDAKKKPTTRHHHVRPLSSPAVQRTLTTAENLEKKLSAFRRSTMERKELEKRVR